MALSILLYRSITIDLFLSENLLSAFGAAAFDDILDFFYFKSLGYGHLRYGHLCHAEGFMAVGASEMDVALMVMMVGTMAHAIFLHSRTIVNQMQ